MSCFTEKTDPYRAKQYEEAAKWWQNFIDSNSYCTNKQSKCIYAIRKHNPEAPEFVGSTVNEASEYISKWG